MFMMVSKLCHQSFGDMQVTIGINDVENGAVTGTCIIAIIGAGIVIFTCFGSVIIVLV